MAELNVTTVQLRDQQYDAVYHMVTAADGAEEYYGNSTNPARYETAEVCPPPPPLYAILAAAVAATLAGKCGGCDPGPCHCRRPARWTSERWRRTSGTRTSASSTTALTSPRRWSASCPCTP